MEQVSILQYAYDTLLTGEATWGNLWALKSILRSLELVIGLQVNFHKSNLVGVCVNYGFLEASSNFLHCSIGQIPFKFLGLLVGANPRRLDTWKPIIDMMKRRLASWKNRHISIGFWIVLINSVLSSLPPYFFIFFKVPKCSKSWLGFEDPFFGPGVKPLARWLG